MKISIFGLGYVGCVSAGCLCASGHEVIGVDVVDVKVDLINRGLPTIVEEGIDELIKNAHDSGKLRATNDHEDAVNNSSVSIICVGTPNDKKGLLNLDFIYKTAENIGDAIKRKDAFHVIVIRSTVAPGTNRKVSEILESRSGKRNFSDFAVVSNPEFLREGSAVNDYYHPPYTIFGSDSDNAISILKEIYHDIEAPVIVTDIGVAEMIKYINNSYHALKIAFANEIGNICKELGVDSHKLMEIFVKDSKLNISPAYFKPGMAYGGSCLPKDLKGLSSIAQSQFVPTPILKAVEESNQIQKRNALEIVLRQGRRSVGIVGIAFKQGTDDLRLSPAVELTENLIGKGYQLKIYDPNVIISKLMGKNRSYISEHLPHLSELMVEDLLQFFKESDIIVFNHRMTLNEELRDVLKEKIIIDISGTMNGLACRYYERIN